MLARLLNQILRRPAAGKAPSVQHDLSKAVELQQSGRMAEAESLCRAILERDPANAAALHLLGSALLLQSRPAEACAVLEQLVAREPDSPELHYNLACAYSAGGEPDRAVDHFGEALRLRPDLLAAYVAAAGAFMQTGRLEEAEACYRSAIGRKPDFSEAHYNYGNLLRLTGRHAEAEAHYRAALAANPDFALARQTLLFALNCTGTDPAAIDAEHRAWAMRHADPLTADAPPHGRAGDRERLRIGYVSPDLCTHPIGRFMDNVLAHHDKRRFEVWCYYSRATSDEVSARLRALADRWVECAGLTDADLAARIRADGIDILVDLAGHTKDNRLLAFARKPAPVQATYLGYPTTTGMQAMDYRITDVQVDPPGGETHSIERCVRLPHTYFSFRPPELDIAVGPPPSEEAGHITFGSFNNLGKVSDTTLELWAAVLAGLPDSRLVVKAKDFGEPGVRDAVERRFERAGIPRNRLFTHAWEDTIESHYAFYRRIDIGLDSYPYNGATTTCEALWMGVPVVTLRGPTHASRMGASILAACGLPEFIAAGPQHYVALCTRLAHDRPRLSRIRGDLRARLLASHLTDGRAFARALEHAYLGMWAERCSR